ncbi:MAG: hypothetical protein A3D65_04115 [Candidatus Lloydbacteria bacterium RIFCSPHIGHO2_02_FULL_50_13]|uniref:DoxX family protein n=1 Tax=Candidatus Lloydbacteria bacterium RIFCSPHIGHO2_02_FULL_50_13 TaxID=1798661 RepID=A0A1G2D589_9BACT|nr:MAG: hypothetical protein A3D65_04115 [Candidatus Lloydbacteria bacterium RIFCSPHIGHO2_02_FULL_50_13]
MIAWYHIPMLSLFPELLYWDWSWYVPFIFRVFLGVHLLYVGWAIVKNRAWREAAGDAPALLGAGALLVILGLLFVLGIFVQALSAIGFVLAILALYFRKRFSPAYGIAESKQFYLLIGLVSLSLVFLGPGHYSLDLPL